jgi:DNA-binding IscR family transcriptional regulator
VEAVTMKRIPIDVRILNFLATQPEPVTINQIDDEIDCYPNIIASYLRDLTDKGLVVSIATGKVKRYFLAK